MLRRQQIVLEQELVPVMRQKQTQLVAKLIEQLRRHTNANGMVKSAEQMELLAVQIQLQLEKVNLVIGVNMIATAYTRFLAVAPTANAKKFALIANPGEYR